MRGADRSYARDRSAGALQIARYANKAQCVKTLENLSIALRAVNAAPKDIVKVTTTCTAVVGGLARDTLVEVDAIVYLGKDS